jgi:hypothetical protein
MKADIEEISAQSFEPPRPDALGAGHIRPGGVMLLSQVFCDQVGAKPAPMFFASKSRSRPIGSSSLRR